MDKRRTGQGANGLAYFSKSGDNSSFAPVWSDLFRSISGFESLANRHGGIISNSLQFFAFRFDLFPPSDPFFFVARMTFCSPVPPSSSITGRSISTDTHKTTFELHAAVIACFRRSTHPKTQPNEYQKNYEPTHFRTASFWLAAVDLCPVCGRGVIDDITPGAQNSPAFSQLEGSRTANVPLIAKQRCLSKCAARLKCFSLVSANCPSLWGAHEVRSIDEERPTELLEARA